MGKLNFFVILLFSLHTSTLILPHWEQLAIIGIEASSFFHIPGHLFQLFQYFTLMKSYYPLSLTI